MNGILYLIVAAAWAGSFIAIQPLVAIVPPLWAGAIRIAIGAIAMAVALPLLGRPYGIARSYRRTSWITGLFAFTIPFALLFWGETRISPGLAAILNGTVPIWVFVLSTLITPGAETVTWRKSAGLVTGIIGLCAIFLPKVFVPNESSSLVGALAVFLMAASYAISILINRSLFARAPDLHPFTNLFQQLVAGSLGLIVIAVGIEGVPHPIEWTPFSTVVLAELYVGVVSTSIAFMLFYHLIRAWGSVRAATVTYVVPSIALAFDLAINRHLPTPGEGVGVALVTLGVLILNFPVRVRSRVAPST